MANSVRVNTGRNRGSVLRENGGFGRVLAALGPTNTGKTHFAVERMLAHESGMMGFPLRLLAREIYDNIAAIKGKDAVALTTGEEKIGSEHARYVVATVESMPAALPFSFVAVDEIQLCEDYERGHVFTDRLLNCRGIEETLFLGSETIQPLLRRLVPRIEILTRPRYSRLSFAGSVRLNKLPRRSAIVAFTAADVYAVAEFVRRQRGGAAVVMGSLSPRTRNAQVAMYQSGEVDHLVATDAIGMGLNMDLVHVAFASMRKFDGRELRNLYPSEVGQIAGRAGRYRTDGTFGTTGKAGEFDEKTITAVENHEFQPVKALRWRNSDLDFRSVDSLIKSLMLPSPQPGLIRVRDALDDRSLALLAKRPEVRDSARGRERVQLLWRVCQIPDFRKTLTESHLQLLQTIYEHLTRPPHVLPNDWVGKMISRLDRTDGDIDTLVSRISHVRTWTYLSHQNDWLTDPGHWQGIARDVEDRLSDALHERLTQKFVDRRTAALLKALRENGDVDSAVEDNGEVIVDGHKVGKITGLTFSLDIKGEELERRTLATAARKTILSFWSHVVQEIEGAADGAFSLQTCSVIYKGHAIAMVTATNKLLELDIRLICDERLKAVDKERIKTRLRLWISAWLKIRIAPVYKLDQMIREGALSPEGRGIAFRLIEGFGFLPKVKDQHVIPACDQKNLSSCDVRRGIYSTYIPSMLRPAACEAVELLSSLNAAETVYAPPPGRVSFDKDYDGGSGRTYQGFLELEKTMLRADIVEKVGARLRQAFRDEPRAGIPKDIASWAGLKPAHFEKLLPGLGFRLNDQGGLEKLKKRKQSKHTASHKLKSNARRGPVHSPFAMLGVLKGTV